MDRESASRVLATPLAQEFALLPSAHLAYIGRDGYPRVIPDRLCVEGGSCGVQSGQRAESAEPPI